MHIGEFPFFKTQPSVYQRVFCFASFYFFILWRPFFLVLDLYQKS